MVDLTTSRALVSDGSGDVSVSAVTSTEVGYLDGVTSSIQTQIDAAGGAVTREGGNTSEVTTTSTAAANRIAAASLTIAGSEPFQAHFGVRKTTGGSHGAVTDLQVNATNIQDATSIPAVANEASDAIAKWFVGARLSLYQHVGYNINQDFQGDIFGRADNIQTAATGLIPTVEITDIAARGNTTNAAITMGVTQLQVYSYTGG